MPCSMVVSQYNQHSIIHKLHSLMKDLKQVMVSAPTSMYSGLNDGLCWINRKSIAADLGNEEELMGRAMSKLHILHCHTTCGPMSSY